MKKLTVLLSAFLLVLAVSARAQEEAKKKVAEEQKMEEVAAAEEKAEQVAAEKVLEEYAVKKALEEVKAEAAAEKKVGDEEKLEMEKKAKEIAYADEKEVMEEYVAEESNPKYKLGAPIQNSKAAKDFCLWLKDRKIKAGPGPAETCAMQGVALEIEEDAAARMMKAKSAMKAEKLAEEFIKVKEEKKFDVRNEEFLKMKMEIANPEEK